MEQRGAEDLGEESHPSPRFLIILSLQTIYTQTQCLRASVPSRGTDQVWRRWRRKGKKQIEERKKKVYF